jgi:UDP-N-acetylmuramyl pentapeptide synthase
MKEIFKKCIVIVLTLEAKLALRLKKPTIIAVTGSVGKTTTKDAMYKILSPHVSVRKTQKSYNSDFGIPLSILNLPNMWGNIFGWLNNMTTGFGELFNKDFPKYLILEIGADHPGDISKPASWIKPKYSVFTRLPEVPVHIEFFESKEQVIKEKQSLALHTRKDGVLVLNHDDPLVLAMAEKFSQKSVTYGTHADATLSLSEFHIEKKQGGIFGSGVLIYGDKLYSFSLPRVIAETHILGALPGILIMLEEGFTFEKAVLGLENLEATHGRLSVLKGLQGSILIDDTYNSSPVAVVNALETLKSFPEAKRKIAVLGDMMELGIYAEEEHRKIGQFAPSCVDVLITIGPRSKFTHEEATKAGVRESRWFDTSQHAGEFIKDFLKTGDHVLFKGSQSIRVERALKMCVADESDIEKYLVRQDKEWLKR